MAKRNATFRLVDDIHANGALKVPGVGKFWSLPDEVGPNGLNFWCPCGCGSLLGVRWPPWTWDGNREAPTVCASILHSSPGGCGWHGFLTAGEFVEC